MEELKKAGLIRKITDRDSAQGARITLKGRELVNFASNDYLGLAAHTALVRAAEKALRDFGAGAGASRLLAGGCELHARLEAATAEFKGTEAALLFNSGYAANTGAIPAIAGEDAAVFSDELNHASIIDGCRLSRAGISVYRHADTAHLSGLMEKCGKKTKIVITDTVFSMQGDLAPLGEINRLCEKHGATLYIDDAHGTGVLGGGRGALAHLGIAPGERVIQMGTFSKAMGSMGGFVAAQKETVSWLTNRARSFMYSTALPPAAVAASLEALLLIQSDPSRIEKLWRNRELLFSSLKEAGIEAGDTQTPIIPIPMPDTHAALRVSGRLLDDGIYAPAIRPPTVPKPIIRLTVTAAHRRDDIERLMASLARHL